MKKIIIVALALLLTACSDNHTGIVKITSLEGNHDTINISYYGSLSINTDYNLVDSKSNVKAHFVKSFSQLQTK
jgi:hypothetical protein